MNECGKLRARTLFTGQRDREREKRKKEIGTLFRFMLAGVCTPSRQSERERKRKREKEKVRERERERGWERECERE